MEYRSVQKQLAELKEEEALLQKSQELSKLKQELADKKKTVQKLRGKSSLSQNAITLQSELNKKSKPNSKKLPNPSEKEEITIQDLRNDKNLKKKVQKELKSIGLVFASEYNSSNSSASDTATSSSSSSEGESSDSDIDKKKKKKKKKKYHKKKSGMKAKSADKVKFPQKWPHAHLQYEYVNKQMSFQDLDFKMFICGELEIASGEKYLKLRGVAD